jgi:hypothetical protein
MTARTARLQGAGVDSTMAAAARLRGSSTAKVVPWRGRLAHVTAPCSISV